MKKIRAAAALALVLVLCLSMAACGLSEEAVVGTWSGTYEYDGNSFSVAFVISEDGTYAKAVYKNGSPSSSESGEWYIEGNELNLDDNDGVTPYKYKGGVLVNNGHEFTKD